MRDELTLDEAALSFAVAVGLLWILITLLRY